MKLILLLIITLLSVPAFKDCNLARFGFFSHFSLGQLDELNPTFDSVYRCCIMIL